jgi:outer membrane protein assembly factor BamB
MSHKPSSKLFLIFFLLFFITFFAVKYREKIHPSLGVIHPRLVLSKILWKLDPYHEIRTTLFLDSQKEIVKRALINREDRVLFPVTDEDFEYFREKWKFRTTSISENYGRPLVDDIDKDGIPDVFMSSGSSKVYRLNGLTGEVVWEYALPFGLASTYANFLADLDGDDRKEFVFGTSLAHPIRVYALRTGKNENNRVYWTRNVQGDFFSGGLNFFQTANEEIRIVTATRDAPYARGSMNILDVFGDRVVPELPGFDVCNNRPTFVDVNADGELDIILGSHGYSGAKYANNLTAIDSLTGSVIWSTPVGTDTGWLNFPILDIDSDGEKEILLPRESNKQTSSFLIFSLDGHKKGEIKGNAYQANFPNSDGSMNLLYTDHSFGNFHAVHHPDFGIFSSFHHHLQMKVLSQNLKTGKINFELPLIAHNIVSILDLDADGTLEILATLKIDKVLTLLVLNAYNGKLKSLHRLNSRKEIKSKYREDELSNLFKKKIEEDLSKNNNLVFLQNMDSVVLLVGLFNLPLPETIREEIKMVLYERISQGVKSGLLVDLDSDGYWELLGMENRYFKPTRGIPDPQKGYYSAYDLPFPVLKGYATGNTHTAFRHNLFKPRGESN